MERKKIFYYCQSVKNTDTAKGYDKKISGIKKHTALDILLHAISLTKANFRKVGLNMFYLYHNNLNNIQNILGDAGCSANKFANSKILHCPVGIAKKNTLHTFSVIPKRWIVHLHG